jgi:hypothetical protein
MRVKFDQCGDALCGNVVWVKPGSDMKAKVGQRQFYDMRRDGTRPPVRQSRQPRERFNLFGQVRYIAKPLRTN